MNATTTTISPLCGIPLAVIAGALVITAPVSAHHAMEFIETESYTTLRQGEFLYHLHYDYYVEDKDDPTQDHWEITPGLAYGITDRFMVDAHVHFAKFENGLIEEEFQEDFAPDGPSPFLEAAAFTVQYRLTDDAPINVAVIGTLEVPFSRARDLLDAREVYEGKLVLSRDFGQHGNITLNLGWAFEGSEDESVFALGVRHPISADPHGPAAGLELLADLEDFSDSWTILPGIYIPVGSGDSTVLKTGIEMSEDMDYLRVSVSIMHSF